MPTLITHAIAAGALSTIAPDAVPRVRLGVVLAVLAMLPDLDVIGLRLGVPYADPLGHRGFSHSLLFAAAAAGGAAAVMFRSVPALSRTWCALVALLFAASASHGLLDAFTDAGLGVGFFIPFDNTRYFAPWRPLATSPLSVAAFLSGPALRILLNELIFVGIPLAGFLGAWHFFRLRRSARR